MEQPTALLLVKGLRDGEAARRLGEALQRLPGVRGVQVEPAFDRVRVTLAAADAVTAGEIEEAVDDAGLALERIEMP